MTTVAESLDLDPYEGNLLGALIVFEVLLVVGYFTLTPARPITLRYVVYPFVWINLGLWAVLRIDPAAGTPRIRALAGIAAGGYFVALAFLTGLVGLSLTVPVLSVGSGGIVTAEVGSLIHVVPAHAGVHTTGWQVTMASPGWGPRIAYVSHVGFAYFIPYRVLGYLSLSYLVYAAALDAVHRAVPGVVGLASCVGCSFPLATAAAGLGGSAAALAGAVTGFQVDLSTAVFIVAVGLLSWRPDR